MFLASACSIWAEHRCQSWSKVRDMTRIRDEVTMSIECESIYIKL